MPRRDDLETVMVIGSGPIVIGQAAEFDFSGSQALIAAREEGYRTVLVNSNPATIQTDLEMADEVYVEPITPAFVGPVIEKARPDGILSGMGGQTGLNVAAELAESGLLEELGVELLGTNLDAIYTSEDRDAFATRMREIGQPICTSRAVTSVEDAKAFAETVGYPCLVRPAYTLGGTGGGIARSPAELERIAGLGIARSRIGQVLIEESVLGWKEYEYEVMRDGADTCITVCNMENLDPMGVHTGESCVVAPAQTLSDDDHQLLRTSAIEVIRSLDIEGGCNIQFAVDPETGDYRVVEVNPRVSRSSALASKATGYPIARVAAKIGVGYRLDEVPNAITKRTYASFEPTLDYVVTKIPRWPFDKFPHADRSLGTQMKSTGETMAIGRTIEESFLKAARSLEVGRRVLRLPDVDDGELAAILSEPKDRRFFALGEAFVRGWTLEEVAKATRIEPFFLAKVQRIADVERRLGEGDASAVQDARGMGFSRGQVQDLWGGDGGLSDREGTDGPRARTRDGPRVVFKMVDTCGAEFAAETPYYYSTLGDESEVPDRLGDRDRIVVVGSGPVRIGQGVEFDYCCVHAARAFRELGYETVMVNNNPETVSTDFDTSDHLFFEPLDLDDLLGVIREVRPRGVALQFGGQTPVNLAVPLKAALVTAGLDGEVRILGTDPEAIDMAEDRERFAEVMDKLGIPQARFGHAGSVEEAAGLAADIGYPVLVRPSYVLGGRAMEVVHDEEQLRAFAEQAVEASPDHPILVDQFLTPATEVDVDAVCDGRDVLIGGIMQHIEEAGVHSGDSACVLPPQDLPDVVVATIERYTREIALALDTVGLINIQFAVRGGEVFVLEANPRASRTVPFVSKATGVPLARITARVLDGERIAEMDLPEPRTDRVAVKVPVFPFQKLPGLDAVLGPEMKSTGEVMGVDRDFARAYYKALAAAGLGLPTEGRVYVSVRDRDKEAVVPVCRALAGLGFALVATQGTAAVIRDHGLDVDVAWKVSDDKSPDALDLMRRGDIALVINTPEIEAGHRVVKDGYMMRRLAVDLEVPYLATVAAARAAVGAIEAAREGDFEVEPLG